MKRSVLLTIDDDRVTDLEVRGKVGPFRLMKSWTVPVPPDDRLAQALPVVLNAAAQIASELGEDTAAGAGLYDEISVVREHFRPEGGDDE